MFFTRTKHSRMERLDSLQIFTYFSIVSLCICGCFSQSAEDFEGSSTSPGSRMQLSNGYCEAYQGDLCRNYVSTRKMVYFRASQSQRENELLFQENLYSIKQAVSPECYSTVFQVICLHLFPPCQQYIGGPRPLRMCREHCQRLKKSPCIRGFRMLSDISIIKEILTMDCTKLPYVDSSTDESCSQVKIPDIVTLREEACRQQHQTRGRDFENANVILPAMDESAICTNVVWKSFDSNVTHILNGILPTLNTPDNTGRFALSASDVYCFQMRLKFSALVDDASKYRNLVSLPKLPKPSLTSFVPGFSVRVGENKAKEQLTFPVGFLSNYVLDTNLVIPNVTLYYSADQAGTKLFGEGIYNLCGTEFKIRIEQTSPDVTSLSGQSVNYIDLSTVELAFGLKEPSIELLSLLRRFDVMNKRLTYPEINIIWDSNGKRVIRFSGKSSFAAWGSSLVDIELILGPNKSYWVAGASTEGRNFADIFHVLSGMDFTRLAQLLDVGINLGKLGMIFATDGASNPVQEALQFQSEPLRSMSKENPTDGFFFEASGKVKTDCVGTDDQKLLCHLLQYAIGAGTEATVKALSTWSRVYFEIGFNPTRSMTRFSSLMVAKLKKLWQNLNPLTKLSEKNVKKIELDSGRQTDFAARLPISRFFWFQRIQINIQFWAFHSGFLYEKPVEIKAYVFEKSKRYLYKIQNITLDRCLTIVNELSDVMKK